MARNKSKHRITHKGIFFVATIVMLNLIGVSYAFWDSGLNLTSTVYTGNMDVIFDQNLVYKLVGGKGDLTVRFEDPRTMVVEGSVDEEVHEKVTETEEATIISGDFSDYNSIINFNLLNNGSVPAEIVDTKLNNVSGASISLDHKSKIIYSGQVLQNNNENSELKIQAGKGDVDFEVEFRVTQPD